MEKSSKKVVLSVGGKGLTILILQKNEKKVIKYVAKGVKQLPGPEGPTSIFTILYPHKEVLIF